MKVSGFATTALAALLAAGLATAASATAVIGGDFGGAGVIVDGDSQSFSFIPVKGDESSEKLSFAAAGIASLPKLLALGANGGAAPSELLQFALGGENGATGTISAVANTDPFITFAISVTDLGAASSFTIVFTIPTVPMVGPHSATSSLGLTITDGGTDGASATPPPLLNILLADVGDAGDPGGSSTCPAGVDTGVFFSVGAGATGTTSTSAGPVVYNPSVGCDSRMFVTVGFTGTGGGDNYGLTGRFDLNPVPAPSVLALFGAALATIGLAARRRRS